MADERSEERVEESERLTRLRNARNTLREEVSFIDIPLTSDDLALIKDARRAANIYCPKWYDKAAYSKKFVDPLVETLLSIGYRAGLRSVREDEDADETVPQ